MKTLRNVFRYPETGTLAWRKDMYGDWSRCPQRRVMKGQGWRDGGPGGGARGRPGYQAGICGEVWFPDLHRWVPSPGSLTSDQ